MPDGFWYAVKRRAFGTPLLTEQLTNQRLSRPLALGVLSCDGLSSAAYGTEEILYALLPFFGLAAFTLVLPMTLLVLAGVVLVVLSYREVVSVYTQAGGSYVVARENFGPRPAQVAAVALLIDYSPLAGRLLHDHTADRIARQVSRVHGASAMIIPFDVRHRVDTLHARRSGQAAGLRDYERPIPPDGTDPIGSLRPAGRATVQGRLHAAEVRPAKHHTMLACEVADSTGDLTALFYGRAHIAGMEPGRRIRLHARRSGQAAGRPTMINPGYELLK